MCLLQKLESVFMSQKDELRVLHSIADELIQQSQTVDVQKVKSIIEATDQRWNYILCRSVTSSYNSE